MKLKIKPKGMINGKGETIPYPAKKPKPDADWPEATLLCIGRAVTAAEKASTEGRTVEQVLSELGWTEAGVLMLASFHLRLIKDARAFRAFVPIRALPSGSYFTQPPGGSAERAEGMKLENIADDSKVVLPSGKTETWSSDTLVKPNPAPSFVAASASERDAANRQTGERKARKREAELMTPEEIEAARRPIEGKPNQPKRAL